MPNLWFIVLKTQKIKKAPLMELRSFLRVGIRLVMTTTMTLLNQNKEGNAIWNRKNALYADIQKFILLDT